MAVMRYIPGCPCCIPVATNLTVANCWGTSFSDPIQASVYPDAVDALDPYRLYLFQDEFALSLGDTGAVDEERAEWLLNWVEAGGRLIVGIRLWKWITYAGPPSPPDTVIIATSWGYGNESLTTLRFNQCNDLLSLLGAGISITGRVWETTQNPGGTACTSGNRTPDTTSFGAVPGGGVEFCGDPGNLWGDAPWVDGLDTPFTFGGSSYLSGGESVVTVMGATDVGVAVVRIGDGCIAVVTGSQSFIHRCSESHHPFDLYAPNRELWGRLLHDHIDDIVV